LHRPYSRTRWTRPNSISREPERERVAIAPRRVEPEHPIAFARPRMKLRPRKSRRPGERGYLRAEFPARLDRPVGRAGIGDETSSARPATERSRVDVPLSVTGQQATLIGSMSRPRVEDSTQWTGSTFPAAFADGLGQLSTGTTSTILSSVAQSRQHRGWRQESDFPRVAGG